MQDRSIWVLGGGLVLGSLVPFTLVVIFPTNSQLQDQALDLASPDVMFLLRRWARLHAVRTVASLVAFALILAHFATNR